jgi:very-short-patch-repair endonuclease
MKGQTNSFILKNKLQRKLRRNLTDAERLLWRRLRDGQINGHKFRRQHPYGDFILDFVCLEMKLVIEVDGGQHSESDKDVSRDQLLVDAGFRVMRFWNNQVMTELDAVVESIGMELEKITPSPP